MRHRRRWTAEDYNTIETLTQYGMSARRIGQFLDPPADGRKVADACRAAGIQLNRKPGRPSITDRLIWDRLYREHAAALAADAEQRARIVEFAASLGYAVTIRRLGPGQTS